MNIYLLPTENKAVELLPECSSGSFSSAGCAGYYVKSGKVNSLQIDAYTVNRKTGFKISN